MKYNKITLLCYYFLLALKLFAQEVPVILPFKDNNAPALQSWMVTQDCDGLIYVANTEGVMIFNGLSWQKLVLPSNQIPRSIFKGRDCKIYVGGFETLGFIDRSDPLQATFHALKDSLLKGSNQEIWNIIGNEAFLVAQSFSNTYIYDYRDVKPQSPPFNIMLGNSLQERIFIPRITEGLFELKPDSGTFSVIEGVEALPSNSKVVSVQYFDQRQKLLLATQYNGVYLWDQGKMEPMRNAFVERLQREQINKLIRLQNGDYVIGTILNGLYITSDFQTIKHHINRATGLTNNTVLSLFQDRAGDLWVGLDKGVNLLKLSNPVLRYYDLNGLLGTIYTTIDYEGALYIGTNKGLFIKTDSGTYDLVENSQGQVWSLIKAGDDLLCGHNAGTFLVDYPNFTTVSTITGGWWMEPIDTHKIMQSSYTGLVILEELNNQWQVQDRVQNGNLLIERFALVDHSLVGYHSHYGLCVLNFEDDFSAVSKKSIIDSLGGKPINSSVIINKIENDIYIFFEKKVYQLADEDIVEIDYAEVQQPLKSSLNDRYRLYLQLAQLNKEDITINFRRLPNKISGKGYIVSSSDGYMVFTEDYLNQRKALFGIYLEAIYAEESQIQADTSEVVALAPKQNDLSIHLANQYFIPESGVLQYQLKGWDESWYNLPKRGKLQFINLDDGDYTLIIRDNKESRHLLRFSIAPHWYESWSGGLLYLFGFTSLLLAFEWWSKRKLRLETQKLKAEKQRELESLKMKANNEKLKREVLYKSKMLANSAMTLIQKNNMLNELKAMIKKEDPESWHQGRPRQKMLNIIQRNINSDQDWEIFERNFEEVHEDFLNKLKKSFPDITPGELRMAAYIRMNLSSKEIAPILNISVRSVENKRYRLRKKMELSASESLADYLMRL